MTKIFVKPAEGLKVPLPRALQVNGAVYLKPEGELVDDDVHWRKRERDKDVTISLEAPAAPAEKAQKEAPRASAKGE